MPTEARDLQAEWTVVADNDPHETAWTGDDVVIGRKRRGATLLHLYQDAPEELGILRPWLANRLVVYKYYKNLANNAALYLGMETLYEVSHSALTSQSVLRGVAGDALRRTKRPPLMVTIARRMVKNPQLALTPVLPGLWTTQPDQDPDPQQMLVVEADRLPDLPGTGLLRWTPLPSTDEERTQRVAALLNDPCLKTANGELLLQDIMNEELPTGPGEAEEVRGYLTPLQQLRNALSAAEAAKAAAEAAKAAAEAQNAAAARALRAELGEQLTPEVERVLQAMERGADGVAE